MRAEGYRAERGVAHDTGHVHGRCVNVRLHGGGEGNGVHGDQFVGCWEEVIQCDVVAEGLITVASSLMWSAMCNFTL